MTRIHSENEGLNPKQSPALRAKPVSGVYASNPKYSMILAQFIGKKKWQIDAHGRRRVEAFPIRQTRRERRWAGAGAGGSYSSHSAAGRAASGSPGRTRTRSSAGPSTSMISICPWLSAASGPVEVYVPHVDHPCEEFLNRRQYSAVAQIPRVQRQARSVGRDAFVRSRWPGLHQRGCSCRAICFYNALLRSAALLASSTVLRCGQSNVNAAADKVLRQSIGRARYARIEGGRSNARVNLGQGAPRADRGIKFPVRWR
jgi:hypothetical protein